MLVRIDIVLIQLNAKCYVSPMATTLSTSLQTLSLYSGSHGLVVDGKLCLVAWCMPLLWYDPRSKTWTDSESYPSAPPQLQHACVHDGRIIVFLANGHGGGTLVRAADGSWAPYGGVGDSAEAEALKGEGDELMKKGDIESVKGAVAAWRSTRRPRGFAMSLLRVGGRAMPSPSRARPPARRSTAFPHPSSSASNMNTS